MPLYPNEMVPLQIDLAIGNRRYLVAGLSTILLGMRSAMGRPLADADHPANTRRRDPVSAA